MQYLENRLKSFPVILNIVQGFIMTNHRIIEQLDKLIEISIAFIKRKATKRVIRNDFTWCKIND